MCLFWYIFLNCAILWEMLLCVVELVAKGRRPQAQGSSKIKQKGHWIKSPKNTKESNEKTQVEQPLFFHKYFTPTILQYLNVGHYSGREPSVLGRWYLVEKVSEPVNYVSLDWFPFLCNPFIFQGIVDSWGQRPGLPEWKADWKFFLERKSCHTTIAKQWPIWDFLCTGSTAFLSLSCTLTHYIWNETCSKC